MQPAVSLSVLSVLLSCSEVYAAIIGSYPYGCRRDPRASLLTVNCRGKDIVDIPSGLPANTQVLDIRNANITTLKKHSFKDLTSLIKLRIISSNIKTIQSGAFSDIQQLMELNLYDSCRNVFYDGRVFKGLQYLKYLNLQESQCFSVKYPDEDVFNDITAVEELHIFGLQQSLPSGFAKLRNLTNLVISGNEGCCAFANPKEDMFQTLSELPIRHLNISNCRLLSVQPRTFAPLRKLYSLSMNNQRLEKFEHIMNVLKDLRNSSIEFLSMNKLSLKFKCFTFGIDMLLPLKHTPLKELHMENNRMTWIDANFENALPKSIETLSLANNYFLGSVGAVAGLFFLPNLTSLTFSVPEMALGHGGTPFPHMLTSLYLSNTNTKVVKEFQLPLSNILRSLTWTDSVVPEFRGNIKGFNMLETAELTHINCRQISDGYFQFLTALKTLNISNNYLGDVISDNKNGRLFQNLHNLDILDLSSNNIRALPFALLKELTNLTHLYLSRNSLLDWGVDISHMTRLAYIDLSDNVITSLNFASMNLLETHFAVYNTTINLTNNHLICTCDTYNFIHWMQTRRKHFTNFEAYNCQYLNITLSLDEGLSTLGHYCADFSVVISVTSVIIFMITTFITGRIVYKYYNLLLYIYYNLFRKKGDRFGRRNDDFLFDAFISYAEEDFPFVKSTMLPVCEEQNNLKLCIRDRNFMPGGWVTEHICNAVHFSRKTVIIMSSSYLGSGLCMLEYAIARTEQMFTGREVLLLVDYKRVPTEDLSLDIMELRSRAGLEFPEREQHVLIFLERLVRAIRGEDV